MYRRRVDVQGAAVVNADTLLTRVSELEAAVAARDRFIAAVGHELRNAMAPLVLLADAAREAAAGGPPDRRTEMLVRNLELLNRTVDRVSNVAQLRSEKLELKLETVDLASVVGDVIAELAPTAASRAVEMRFAEASSTTGSWDPRHLRQIATHLIVNAIRHSGSTHVEITVRGVDATAELLVADRGCGIDESRRARIFDAFDSADTTRKGGLGVGLWTVQTLCRQFGGTVALLDDHSPGAAFRVLLPRV